MTAFAERLAAIEHPWPRASTITSYAVLAAIVGFGVWSFIGLDYSLKSLEATGNNLSRFLGMATPLQWPGWEVLGTRQADGSTPYETVWVGFEPIWAMVGVVLITLAIVIAGTAIAAVLSIPVAYGAARNTTPNPVVMMICRSIGVVARATPDVVIASFAALVWFNTGALGGILAIGLHSVGMISKMMADAIEQIDEGPRLAIRSAGGSKAQEFWSGVVPQALPAWIAVALHRADINLRGTVLLGVVGVAGLGLELDLALHTGPAGMRKAIPNVLIIIAICIAFEIVSSLIRAKLLGVQSAGRGIGDAVARAVTRKPTAAAAPVVRPQKIIDRNTAIEAAMHRPWTRSHVVTSLSIWLGVGAVVWSFLYADARWLALFTEGSLHLIIDPSRDRMLWPPSFGSRSWETVLAAVVTTLQIAFAATLIGAVISAVVGPLSARNVAPNGAVRNFFRGLALVIRAIPDLVVAIIFIIATGFGPQAGALALGIGGVGLLAKLIGDSLEEVPNGPEKALSAVGGSRSQVFFASTLPMSVPALVAHLMYLLEQNVRSATLLGIVGAGGIGFLIINALSGRHFDEVIAYIMVVLVLVLAIESASMLVRRALK